MADDRDNATPSLEPPSLFGRKKWKPAQPPAATAPVEPTPAVEDDVQETVEDTIAVAEPVAEPVTDDSPTTILDEPTIPVPPPVIRPVAPPASPAPAAPAVTATATSSLTPPPAPATPKAPREPWLTGRPAAVLAGLLVGALIVAATAGSLRVCTEVKGTSSCGGPGLFLLVAILIIAVLVGTALLRAARVPEPGSTSFLAVGLLSVFALLFLVGQLFDWWMIIVIPIVSVCTFLLSHWVTTTYIDPESDGSAPEREPEPHDIR
jgi:hypothetical protein